MKEVNLLKRLFGRRARLDHPEPKKRLDALSAKSRLDEAKLLTTAKADANLEVRSLALSRIESVEALVDFLDDDQLAEQAAEQILSQIDSNHPLMKDPRLLPPRIQAVENIEEFQSLCDQITDPREMASAIGKVSKSDVRLELIRIATNADVLNQCERLSRNHDKQMNRVARERLSTYKTLVQSSNEAVSRAQKLIETAKKQSVVESHYESVRNAVERDWKDVLSTIEQNNEALRDWGLAATDLDELKANFPNRAQMLEDRKPTTMAFGDVLNKLKLSNRGIEDIESAEREWLEVLKEQQPPVDTSNEFFTLIQDLRTSLKLDDAKTELEKKLESLIEPIETLEPNSPESWQQLWGIRGKVRDRIHAIDQVLADDRLAILDQEKSEEVEEQLKKVRFDCESANEKIESYSDKTREKLDSLLENLEEHMNDGLVKQARNVEKSIREHISRLPERNRRPYRNALAPMSARLGQLMQWQRFAAAPKREKLCEQIEALAESAEEPNEQFEAIKNLRKQWNALGQPSSREEFALQKRYDEAAEKAFAVCAEWFDEQSKLRAENLKKREEICDGLETYVEQNDWENPDWRAVINTLRTARDAWGVLSPVNRGKARRTDRKFYKLTNNIQKRINEQWKENIRDKEDIIARAKEACEDQEIETRDLIEHIKALQAEWKNVGATPRKKEEALWRRFREVCDIAFEMRTKQQDQRRQSIDENITQANKLIHEMKGRSNAESDDQRALSRSEIETYQRQLDELVLPKRIRNEADRAVQQARRNVEQQQQVTERRNTVDRLRQLIQLDRELAQYEESSDPPPDDWFDNAGKESVWFESRVPIEPDNSVLYDLVLRCEIAADIPSSEEDSARRLQLQVEDLQQKIGRGKDASKGQAVELLKEWVGTAHGNQPLRDRFVTAFESLMAKNE